MALGLDGGDVRHPDILATHDKVVDATKAAGIEYEGRPAILVVVRDVSAKDALLKSRELLELVGLQAAAIDRAMKKCSARPRIHVAWPPWNELRPNSPLAMPCGILDPKV